MANSEPSEVMAKTLPMFLKIVINPEEHTLKIPVDFAERYRKNLPDDITIQTPDGLDWEMEVIQCDGEIRLGRGLDEFNEHYSIEKGYLLVLKYNCESVFHVHIYDLSASEIQYSHEELIDADENEDISTGNKINLGKVNDDHIGRKMVQHYVAERKNNLAYQKAEASMANSSSIYCISLFQPSYYTYMFVPRRMVKDHLFDTNNKSKVTLSFSGKKWNIRCSLSKDVRICGGWVKFVKDNDLQVGDACILMVDNQDRYLWNVKIIRCSGQKNKIKPSFFKILINKDFDRQLIIPPEFVKQHMNILPKNIELCINTGQTWEVKFRPTGNDEHCFTNGWSEFAKHLQFGEFVVFWFNSDTSTFDVSVFGHNFSERVLCDNMSLVNADSVESKPLLLTGQVDEDNELSVIGVEENECDITEWNKSWPRYERTITGDGRTRVCFYNAFATGSGLKGKKSVELMCPPSKLRSKVEVRERGPPCYKLELTLGWLDFCKAHGLIDIIGNKFVFVYDPEKNVILVKDLGKPK